MIERKIKVAHLSTPFTWRGGEQQIAYLYKGIEELNALGAFGEIEQVLICPMGSELAKYGEENGWNIATFKKRAGTDPFSAAELKRICIEQNIELIHAHDSHAHTMAVLSSSIFRNRTPFVLSRRVDFPLKRKAKTRFKYNHKNLRKIICVSDFIRTLVEPHIHNSSIDVVTVHSGVELEREKKEKGKLRKEFNVADNQIIVANTSALADHKDYFTFLEVAKQADMTEPGRFKFIIFGSGPQKQRLLARAEELELDDSIVVFAGFRTDLDELWPDIDIFLFTSKTEGLGTSVLDAFFHEIPVVSTNAGGIPEMVKHNETGLVSNVGDVKSMADQLIELSKNSSLKEQIVAGASAELANFDRKITAQHTVLHYRDALK